jgi:uncharacterized membrane protein YecN with MAPEG domain
MPLNTTIPSEPLLHIVPSYAAVLALIFIYLAFRVIKQRRKAKVAIGDGNNPALKRAIAVHNNFAQYVPFCLLLITFLELDHAANYIIHGLCITLLVGRLIHAYGVSQEKENLELRKIGMISTFIVYIAATILIFIQVI